MYDNWAANLVVVTATSAAVLLSVLVHYEGLVLLSRWIARTAGHPARRRVLHVVLAVLGLHLIEVWIFGNVFWLLALWPACGHIVGGDVSPYLDAIYLSATTFSTVGYGDIAPVGPIRFLAGTEGLSGLVLIGWSASFTYLEMERYWRVR